MNLKIQTFCSVLLPRPHSEHHIQTGCTYSFQNNRTSNPSSSIRPILMILFDYNFLQPSIFYTKSTTAIKMNELFSPITFLLHFSTLLESIFSTNRYIVIRLQITFVNNFTAKLNLVSLLVKHIPHFLPMWTELHTEEVEVGTGNALLLWNAVFWDYPMYKAISTVNQIERKSSFLQILPEEKLFVTWLGPRPDVTINRYH